MAQEPYVDQLKRLNRKSDLANALNAAQLLQHQRIISQNKELLDLQHQQLAEERQYRFKMWLQSPAGEGYAIWYAKAADLLAAIRAFDEAWQGAWASEISAAISPHERQQVSANRYLPRPLPVAVKRAFNPILVAILTAILLWLVAMQMVGRVFDGSYWALLILLAASTGALTWTLLFDDTSFVRAEEAMANSLRTRRIDLFGVDPLTSPAPSWSVNCEHLAILHSIESVIGNAPVQFPGSAELPAIVAPRCVDPATARLSFHRNLLAVNPFVALGSALRDDDGAANGGCVSSSNEDL
ncbi:hypothetical protein C5U48_23675 [Mycolicibacter virginiensis]|uniref:Uncharacterized protein n=1 Tax=Mycolicibacter virginiensis TaxID=1795032 RepID=A0A9X7NWE4_9MYCO|nr:MULTISPECIES: hypothetical protein [Mycobacteriaceae]PQM49794.1 hypothetical protein C5U48_23675 [Mycolicibacter virginiensis]